MTTYVMRGAVNGAARDVETPPVQSEAEARAFAQQWADELGTPVILFRDEGGQLRHVDNMQPRSSADYQTRDHVYLVIDPRGGPVQSFARERAFEYARNTGGLVARVDVVSDKPEDAR